MCARVCVCVLDENFLFAHESQRKIHQLDKKFIFILCCCSKFIDSMFIANKLVMSPSIVFIFINALHKLNIHVLTAPTVGFAAIFMTKQNHK